MGGLVECAHGYALARSVGFCQTVASEVLLAFALLCLRKVTPLQESDFLLRSNTRTRECRDWAKEQRGGATAPKASRQAAGTAQPLLTLSSAFSTRTFLCFSFRLSAWFLVACSSDCTRRSSLRVRLVVARFSLLQAGESGGRDTPERISGRLGKRG